MLGRELIYFAIFCISILLILILDLTIIGRKKHVISFKEAILWTFVWVSLAMLFYIFILHHGEKFHGVNSFNNLIAIKNKYASGLKLDLSSFENSLSIYRKNMGMEFITGYLIEYTLSMDNVFVIMLILGAFAVNEKYYKQVLFWGILGAIVLRFLFIFTGATLIQHFEWLLLLFGAFLIYSGINVFVNRNSEEKIVPGDHWLFKLLSKRFNVFPKFVKGHFFFRRNHTFYITPLFIVLLIVEFSDLLFAMDSIPAIFAITRDPFVIFFSNIFAIMGLRSLFFLLMRIVNLFHYLKIGISFLLIFVGIKLLAHTWLDELGFKSEYSLYVILATLIICILASIIFPVKEKMKLHKLP